MEYEYEKNDIESVMIACANLHFDKYKDRYLLENINYSDVNMLNLLLNNSYLYNNNYIIVKIILNKLKYYYIILLLFYYNYYIIF